MVQESVVMLYAGGIGVVLRATNGRFKEAAGWSPRYPSARAGWTAAATAIPLREKLPGQRK